MANWMMRWRQGSGLRAEYPGSPLWLAGFSFGAAIAIRAAIEVPADGLVTVAPAVERFAAALDGQPDCPWLIVQGDEDELVDIEATIAWLNTLAPGPELAVMAGAEHFFHGRLVELRELVAAFVQKKGGTVYSNRRIARFGICVNCPLQMQVLRVKPCLSGP